MRYRSLVAIALAAGVLAGCTSKSSGPERTPTPLGSTKVKSDPTTKPPTTNRTISSSASAARTVYALYTNESFRALSSPRTAHSKVLAKYSVDPEFGKLLNYIGFLRSNGIVFRGSPPVSRITVVSDRPIAKPWPKVILRDCPKDFSNWRPVYSATGRLVSLQTNKAPQPNATTATVIYYKSRWVVYSLTTNRNRTCTS